MATLQYLDGFEHGLATAGTAGIYNTVTGSPAVVTNPVRTSARALEISAGGASEHVRYNPTSATRIATMAFYVRFASLPAADVNIANFIMSTVGDGRLLFDTDADQFAVGISTETPVNGGPVLSTDTWYRVVVEYDTSANPGVIKCEVDNGTEFSTTRAQSAEDIAGFCLGTQNAETFTAYYDDWLISGTDGDYDEIKEWTSHEVERLLPTADGTHSISGANQIERTATGTDITNSTTDAYLLVDDAPLDTTPTDYINDVGTDTASYVECTFGDLASSLSSVTAVRGYTVDRDSTGTSTSAAVSRIVTSGGTSISPDLRLSTDDPGTTVTTRKKMLTSSSPPWTPTQANDLRVRCGLGDGAPDVWFASFMLEVALYEPAAGGATRMTTIIMTGGF